MNIILSKAITFVRFPLMIGILFIHNTYSIHYDKSYVGLGYDIYHVICSFGSVYFPSVCVPTFFFISGFLFFYGVDNFTINQYRHKLRNRFFSLILPFLFWNLIPILAIEAKVICGKNILTFETVGDFLSYFWDYKDGGSIRNIFGWQIPIAFPIDSPLWFVRDLILMCILSPLVYGIIKYSKFFGVSFFALLYIFSIWPDTIFLMLANSLCFFSLGAYFSIFKKNIYKEIYSLPLFLFWLFAVVIINIGNYTPVVNNILVRTCNILGVFAIVNFASFFVSHFHYSWPKIFIESVFFVYAAHTIFINGVVGTYLVPFIIQGDHYILLIVKYLLSPAIVWGICLAIYLFLKKWQPSLLMYLNGGR